jgi:PhnB protein
MSAVKAKPEGYHTITPALAVTGGAEAIDFYKKGLAAEVLCQMMTPDGKRVAHAEIKIGDSIFFLYDEFPEMNPAGHPHLRLLAPASLSGSSCSFYVYVDDADAAFKKAIEAGATVIRPVQDQFYGDRNGMVADPFGHFWTFATHLREDSIEEIEKASNENFSETAEAK